MTMFISWLIRYGHIVGAAIWVGGYALLAFFIIPLLGKGPNETLIRLAITTIRVLTYTGTLTMGLGLVLITRTNGFATYFAKNDGRHISGKNSYRIVLFSFLNHSISFRDNT